MTRTSMTCDQFDALLADYLEESCEAGVRSAMAAHRAECLRCAALVRDIEQIRVDAAGLPELPPLRDLWSEISERIDREVVAAPVFGAASASGTSSLGGRRPSRRSSFMTWGVAAAALIAVTSGVTYYATMARVQQGTMGTNAGMSADTVRPPMNPAAEVAVATVAPNRPVVAGQTAPNVAPSTLGQARAPLAVSNALPVLAHAPRVSAMATYDREIADLRDVLAQRRVDLDPGTVAVIERSLTTIDNAVQEARIALASDPASRFLKDQLDKALQKKLGLLRTVALLPARA